MLHSVLLDDHELEGIIKRDEVSVLHTKKMTLGWVVYGEETPRWAAGGIDPPRPWGGS